jgi:hypothetical protein
VSVKPINIARHYLAIVAAGGAAMSCWYYAASDMGSVADSHNTQTVVATEAARRAVEQAASAGSDGGMVVQELLANLVQAQARTQEEVQQARQAAERSGAIASVLGVAVACLAAVGAFGLRQPGPPPRQASPQKRQPAQPPSSPNAFLSRANSGERTAPVSPQLSVEDLDLKLQELGQRDGRLGQLLAAAKQKAAGGCATASGTTA